MILGIGTDLVEIRRMERCAEKEAFLTRVFTDAELAYLAAHQRRPETCAGLFAAKEAVSKALGTGITGFSLKDIEINHNAAGAPFVKLTGGAEQRFLEIGAGRAHLSISHDGGMAAAFAVLED